MFGGVALGRRRQLEGAGPSLCVGMLTRLVAVVLLTILAIGAYGEEESQVPDDRLLEQGPVPFNYVPWKLSNMPPRTEENGILMDQPAPNKRWSTSVRFGKRGSWASQVRFG